jgi:hypothetical protein
MAIPDAANTTTSAANAMSLKIHKQLTTITMK